MAPSGKANGFVQVMKLMSAQEGSRENDGFRTAAPTILGDLKRHP